MKSEQEVRDLCTKLDQNIEYARGWKDGLEWVLADHREGGSPAPAAASEASEKAIRPTSAYRERTATQRPVIEVLKLAERPLTVSEIMSRARSQGHDLLRPSVQRALMTAKRLGLVRIAKRGRYYIPRQEGDSV